jgi:hypothetical protein
LIVTIHNYKLKSTAADLKDQIIEGNIYQSKRIPKDLQTMIKIFNDFIVNNYKQIK